MNHPIVAAPWQLGRSLELILLPLVPEPRDCGRTWVWAVDPIDLFWFKSEGVGDRLLKKLPWQVGDRIFLQEPWCEVDGHYFTQSTTPEAEHLGWQPADTMPLEAAQYWFEVTGVRVVQMKKLTGTDAISAGMPQFLPEQGGSYASLDELFLIWNAAHPNHPWLGDRHFVVLHVKPVTFEVSK